MIWEREGLKGYYRGIMPSVFKAGIAAGIYFGALAESKLAMSKISSNDWLINASSSIIARTFQCLATNPMYVIKTRFEVVGFNEYRNTFDAIN